MGKCQLLPDCVPSAHVLLPVYLEAMSLECANTYISSTLKTRARVFRNGNSQAIRIPADFMADRGCKLSKVNFVVNPQ